MLEDVLKRAMDANEEERVEIFANIAQTPETSLKEVLDSVWPSSPS